MPANTLKIDRSLVVEVARDTNHANLARRVLELACDLRLHTVAEGVEERDQLEVLQGLGCEAVQGYYFFKPLSAADLRTVLHRQRAEIAS